LCIFQENIILDRTMPRIEYNNLNLNKVAGCWRGSAGRECGEGPWGCIAIGTKDRSDFRDAPGEDILDASANAPAKKPLMPVHFVLRAGMGLAELSEELNGNLTVSSCFELFSRRHQTIAQWIITNIR